MSFFHYAEITCTNTFTNRKRTVCSHCHPAACISRSTTARRGSGIPCASFGRPSAATWGGAAVQQTGEMCWGCLGTAQRFPILYSIILSVSLCFKSLCQFILPNLQSLPSPPFFLRNIYSASIFPVVSLNTLLLG